MVLTVHKKCEHGRRRSDCKDCGGGSISASASTGGSASRCRPTRARTAAAPWHLGSASTGGCAASARTVPKRHTPRILGLVDHLQKVVDHTLASREKREWSTTLVRMVDHPRQPVKKLSRGWSRPHPRVERMVDLDHPRGILIFCILTRSSVYMTAHHGYIRDSLPRNQGFYWGLLRRLEGVLSYS